MVAYYSKMGKGKRKLLYIQLDLQDAKKIFAGINMYNGDKELHLTTNSSFNDYIAKRKKTPLAVQICQTRKELDTRLESIGVYL